MSSPTKGQSLRLAVSRTMEKNRVFHLAQFLIRSIEEETIAGVDLLHTLETVRRTSNPDLDYFRDLNESKEKTSAAGVGMEKNSESTPANANYQAVSSGTNKSLQIDHLPQINESSNEDLPGISEKKKKDRDIVNRTIHEMSEQTKFSPARVMTLGRSKSLPSLIEFANQNCFEEKDRRMSELRSFELSRLHHVPKHANEMLLNEKPKMMHGIFPNLECIENMSSEDTCKQHERQAAISVSSDELEVKSLDDDTQSDDGSFLREFYPSKECISLVRGKTHFDKDNFVANYVVNLPLRDRQRSVDVDLTKLFNENVGDVDDIEPSLLHVYADVSSSDSLHSSRQHKENVVRGKRFDKRSAKHSQNMREVACENKPSSRRVTFQRRSKHLIDYSNFIHSYQLYKQKRDERFNIHSKPETISWGETFVQNLFNSEPTLCQKSQKEDYEQKKRAWNRISCAKLTVRDKTERYLSEKEHESASSSSHCENKIRCKIIPKLPSTGNTKRHLPDIHSISEISKGRSVEPLTFKPHRSCDATYVDYKKLDTRSISSKKPGKIRETRHAKEK